MGYSHLIFPTMVSNKRCKKIFEKNMIDAFIKSFRFNKNTMEKTAHAIKNQ
jgi:hypothetical protein